MVKGGGNSKWQREANAISSSRRGWGPGVRDCWHFRGLRRAGHRSKGLAPELQHRLHRAHLTQVMYAGSQRVLEVMDALQVVMDELQFQKQWPQFCRARRARLVPRSQTSLGSTSPPESSHRGSLESHFPASSDESAAGGMDPVVNIESDVDMSDHSEVELESIPMSAAEGFASDVMLEQKSFEDSSAWEWPLTKKQKQCRVRIINKVLADMNVQELLNERKQLKEKILALRRQNLKAGPRRPVREPQLDEVDAGRVGNEAPKCPKENKRFDSAASLGGGGGGGGTTMIAFRGQNLKAGPRNPFRKPQLDEVDAGRVGNEAPKCPKDNKRCDSAASSGRGGAGGGTTMIAFRGQNLKTGPRNPFRKPQLDEVDADRVGNEAPKCPQEKKRLDSAASSGGGGGGRTTMIALRGQNLKTGQRRPVREPQLEFVELDRVGNDEPNCPKENKHCNSAASTGGGGGGVETSRIKEEEEEEEEEWDCDEEGYMWWKDKTGRWWVLAADGSWWTEDDDGEWLWEGDWWEAHWEEEGDQPEAQEERVGPTRGTGGKSGTNNQGEEKKV